MQTKEDVDDRSDRAGCRGVWFEVKDSLPSDVIFLVFQGEDNLSGLMEVLNWGVHGDETVPDEEHEIQEGPEIDCLTVVYAIGVFAVPEA